MVLEAKDSPTAFAFAQENAFDVVILSLQDEKTGLETCSRFAHEFDIPVLYVTERAVFSAGAHGLVLEEIAPGIDLQRDILDLMSFRPGISETLKTMDPALFRAGPMTSTVDPKERVAAR